jgi:hypothetical protein
MMSRISMFDWLNSLVFHVRRTTADDEIGLEIVNVSERFEGFGDTSATSKNTIYPKREDGVFA